MSIPPISPAIAGVDAGSSRAPVKADQVTTVPPVSRNIDAIAPSTKNEMAAIPAHEDAAMTQQVAMSYDHHGKVHVSYLDKSGRVIFQTPSALAAKREQLNATTNQSSGE